MGNDVKSGPERLFVPGYPLKSLLRSLSTHPYDTSWAMRLLLAALFLGQCVLSSAATCYAPDGGERTSNDIAPCSDDPSDPLSHVCCNMNRPKAPGTSTNASEIRDTCLPNGLCQNESLLKDGSVYLQWGRNFCTQRDWTTGQCLDNVCTNTAQGVRTVSNTISPSVRLTDPRKLVPNVSFLVPERTHR